MVFSKRYITHLGTKLIILAGELSSSVAFSNISLAPPFIHEASTTLCQCRRWAEHLRQAQADILAVSYPAVAFPVTSCSVFSTQPKPLLLAIAAQLPCPWDTRSAPECTALVLNSLPSEITKSFFLLLARAEFPVVLVVWKHKIHFTILETHFPSRVGWKERERGSGIHACPIEDSWASESHCINTGALPHDRNETKTKQKRCFCFVLMLLYKLRRYSKYMACYVNCKVTVFSPAKLLLIRCTRSFCVQMGTKARALSSPVIRWVPENLQ